MSTMTAAENLKDCKAKMGADLGTIYYELYSRHTSMLFKWAEYVELFGTTPQRIALLNTCAPQLFHFVQDAMWNDALLDLAKLTDDPSPGPRGKKHETLTIRRLPALVDPTIRKRVARAVGVALKSVEFARDWRNRHLAHLDLALAINGKAKPLKPASRAAVKAALRAIASVFEILEGHYLGVTVDRGERSGHSAVGLLYQLREAHEARTAKSARIKAGTWTPEDLASLQDRRPV